jgi:PHD/YefM family antitoxin component YafN of YafNO toxin-antitoxin module
VKTFSVQEASDKLSELVEDVLIDHRPALIFGKHKNVVLVAESDWTARIEKMHLLLKPCIQT